VTARFRSLDRAYLDAMHTRRRFLGQLATGLGLIAWRPAYAGSAEASACRIVRPGDPDYDEARTDFNTRLPLPAEHPGLIFNPATRGVRDGRRNDIFDPLWLTKTSSNSTTSSVSRFMPPRAW